MFQKCDEIVIQSLKSLRSERQATQFVDDRYPCRTGSAVDSTVYAGERDRPTATQAQQDQMALG